MALIDERTRFIWPECQASCMVFMGGRFEPTLSSLSYLPASITDRDGELQISISSDLSAPLLQMIFLDSAKVRLNLGPGAQLNVVQTLFGNAQVETNVEMGSQSRLRIADLSCEGCPARTLRACLGCHASLHSFSHSNGAQNLKRRFHLTMNQEGAEIQLMGLDRLKNDQQIHTESLVEHLAPFCTSRQHFKNVLHDRSRSVCEKVIRVEREAKKSEARQLIQNLLLSDEARAIIRPNLDILSGDGIVHHGATFSRLNAEEQFYCQSRGIPTQEAKELLQHAFCQEMIDAIEIPELRARVS